ncbi:MAG: DUF3857 domain-containing protein [Sandaracinobacter sp.]
MDTRTGPLVWEGFDQTVDVNPDGSGTKTITQTVRPLTPDGVQAISIIPFPVSRSLQRFELLEGWVETPEGRRVRIDPRKVITQAPPFAAQTGTLSDVELKVITVPQLAAGGRLHLAVRITQQTPYFPGRFFDPIVYLPFLPRQQSTATYRVLIARALYRQPRFIFADEVTANLDPDNHARIGAMLGEVRATRIIVTHRGFDGIPSRVVGVANGRAVEVQVA